MTGGAGAAASTRTRAPLFYGWVIAVCCALLVAVSNGMTISGMAIFYPSIIDELHWNRKVIASAGSVTLLGVGSLVPIVGLYLDRIAVRRLLLAGAAVLSCAMLAYSRIRAPWHMYGVHALFAIGLSMTGTVACITLISRWFVRRRGAAVGIVSMGTSLGGVVFPLLSAWLIARVSWRGAMAVLGGGSLVLIAALVLLLLKDDPADVGSHPDGAPAPPGDAAPPKPSATGLAAGEALRTGSFWLLAIGGGLSFCVILSLNQQLVLHLRSPAVGMDQQRAAVAQSLLFVCSMSGKLLFGLLSDRLPGRWVNLACSALMCAGTMILLRIDAVLIYPFCVLFGLGYGGIIVTVNLMIMQCFGTRALGKLLGLVSFIEALGAAAGNVAMGWLYDATGSYGLSFRLLLANAFVALLAMTGLALLHRAPAPAARGPGYRIEGGGAAAALDRDEA